MLKTPSTFSSNRDPLPNFGSRLLRLRMRRRLSLLPFGQLSSDQPGSLGCLIIQFSRDPGLKEKANLPLPTNTDAPPHTASPSPPIAGPASVRFGSGLASGVEVCNLEGSSAGRTRGGVAARGRGSFPAPGTPFKPWLLLSHCVLRIEASCYLIRRHRGR
jgi:hypothetical protein